VSLLRVSRLHVARMVCFVLLSSCWGERERDREITREVCAVWTVSFLSVCVCVCVCVLFARCTHIESDRALTLPPP
jgi:hypothetical protein